MGAGDGAEESRENKVMNFARYMMKQGALPINGTNEGKPNFNPQLPDKDRTPFGTQFV